MYNTFYSTKMLPFERFLTVVLTINYVYAAKQRPWIGPLTFFEGQLPSDRSGHGFVPSDNKFYVFGGLGPDGKLAIYSGSIRP